MNVVQQYKAWVRTNSNLIGAIEGVLSSLTWLLPDRFSESELSLEALNSFLGLLSLCHESILQEPVYSKDQKQPVPWPLWLGAIKQVEVLVEMAAQSQSKQGNLNLYTPLTVVEAVKALLKYIILQRSGDRILTDGGMTSGDGLAGAVYGAFARFRARHCLGAVPQQQTSPDKSAAISEGEATAVRMLQHVSDTAAAAPTTEGETTDRETKGTLSDPELQQAGHSGMRSIPKASKDLSSHPLPPSPGSSPYWWDLPQDALWPEEEAQSELESESSLTTTAGEKMREVQAAAKQQQALATTLIKAGEVANICRPLAYVIALRWYGRKSWKPWLFSLAVDVISGHLSNVGAKVAQREIKSDDVKPGLSTSGSMLLLYSLQAFKWNQAEQRELTRRKLLIMFYLIRSPFFDQYTKGVVDLSLSVLRPVPLVGSLAEKAREILYGIQQYYTYTSAS
ncbi:MAG: peroxisome biogenesis 16-like [Trebouxia sp. A1-2]|nr:MAG: peroxisome biogenesis 16-like [Trebouxia sp. A1-2]